MTTSRSRALDENKLQVPVATDRLVAVPRLDSLLESGLGRRVVCLEAPAGYGKTTWLTRLSALAQSRGCATAWLTLDSEHNDVVRFMQYCTAGLLRAAPRFKHNGAALARSLGSLEMTLARMTEAMRSVETELALFFDDWHVIHNEDVQGALRWFIHRGPETMRICIATRTPAPLRLGKLRLEGQVLDIGVDDLSLQPAEAAAFVAAASGSVLSEVQMKRLHQRTEGWVAGLQLASSALRKAPDVEAFVDAFSGSDRDITRYLGEIVLDQLPEPVRALLMRTALFDRFSVEFCSDVLQIENAIELIDEVRSRNLFLVSLDRQEHWYRYHHLFADYLKRSLQRTQPDEARRLYAKASAWCEQHGATSEAVRYAIAGGEEDRAAGLIAKAANTLIHMRGEHETLISWIAALPAGCVRRHPALRLIYVRSLMHVHRYSEADHELRGLEKDIAARSAQHRPPAALAEQETHEAIERGCSMTRCLYHAMVGDMRLTHRTATDWLARCEPSADAAETATVLMALGLATALGTRDNETARTLFLRAKREYVAAGSVHGDAWAESMNAGLHVFAGDFHEAEKILVSVREFTKHKLGPATHGHAVMATLYAQVCYEQNRLEQAESILADVELYSRSRMLSPNLASPHVVKARLLFLKGSLAEADAFLTEALKAVERTGLEGFTTMLSTERVLLHLRANSVRPAQRLADAARLEELFDDATRRGHGTVACWSPTAVGLVLARLDLAKGDLARAQQRLTRLMAEARRCGLMTWLARQLCVQAHLLVKQGERDQARAVALEAAEHAVVGGMCRSLMDEGPLIGELLREAARDSAGDGMTVSGRMKLIDLEKLLDAFGQPLPHAAELDEIDTTVDMESGLSERELQILELVDRGLRNQELANHLFLSETTVKWHLRNIYSKLDVRNRTGAVARARQLALLRR
jgi:LuxR family maltose regulon positive regulatory protein